MKTLLAIMIVAMSVLAMSKINLRTVWFDPNWRHQLTNAGIAFSVLGVLGLFCAAIYTVIKTQHLSLAVHLMGGAALGMALGWCIWRISNSESKKAK